MTRHDLIKIIENFLDDAGGPWEWDDFTSSPKSIEKIEVVRIEIMSIEKRNPAINEGWCSEDGLTELGDLLGRLKGEDW